MRADLIRVPLANPRTPHSGRHSGMTGCGRDFASVSDLWTSGSQHVELATPEPTLTEDAVPY